MIHEVFGDPVHQTIALPHQKHWRNVDLTVEELLEHSDDPVALENVVSPNLAVHDRRSATTVGALMRPALVPVLSLAGRFAGAGRIAHEHAVLDLRSERVLDAVLAEDHDAVLIWGAAHPPGMGRIIASAGYELAARTWRPGMARQRIIDGIRAPGTTPPPRTSGREKDRISPPPSPPPRRGPCCASAAGSSTRFPSDRLSHHYVLTRSTRVLPDRKAPWATTPPSRRSSG